MGVAGVRTFEVGMVRTVEVGMVRVNVLWRIVWMKRDVRVSLSASQLQLVVHRLHWQLWVE